MASKERLSSSVENSNEVIDSTKNFLSILETQTWSNFFKNLINSVKDFFGVKSEKKTSSKKAAPESTHSSANNPIDYSKADTSKFAPGDCPFAEISPYKGIKAYDLRNLIIVPVLGFEDLSKNGTEGDFVKLKVKDEKERFSKKTAGYKKNNPCNVSPFKGDVGRNGSSKVADGQNHAKYNSMEDGLASFMRLMRQDRYRNKSIQGINCSGMQGIYNPSEPYSLQALRIVWITNACNHLNVSPFQRLNLDDKETMMAWAQETAIRESGSHFSRETLERAYNKAFG